jgi:cell fate regulator YaaT (PSP1 superfamily)
MSSVPGVLVPVKLTSVGRPQPALVTDPDKASSLVPGNHLVVETEAGAALGTVASGPKEVARRQAAAQCPLRVIRIATAEDVAARRRQHEREAEAYRVGLMKVRERGLAMKLTRVEHLFDGSRLIFYFTAEGRVDFRELVRELASEFRTRIEMRQVGVRDEAKMLGGYGSCGRPLCCTTWLQSFEPISIKMAKQQELSLNPSKLSGLCGRLKCCLRYELPNGGDGKELKAVERAEADEPGDHVPSTHRPHGW